MGYVRIYSVFSNKQYVQISGHSPLPPCPLYLLYISPLSFQILFWYSYGFVSPLSFISTFVWSQISSLVGSLVDSPVDSQPKTMTSLTPQNLPVASTWVRENAVSRDEDRDLWILLALTINENQVLSPNWDIYATSSEAQEVLEKECKRQRMQIVIFWPWQYGYFDHDLMETVFAPGLHNIRLVIRHRWERDHILT